jgi:uncharacterized protein
MLRTARLILVIAATLMWLSPSAIAPAAAAPASAEPAREKNLFVFIYRPGPAWRAGVPMKDQGLGPHAKYIKSLLDGGQLLAGGGFADNDGGMAILTAANIGEARDLLAADPAIKSGIFTAIVEHWRPRFRAAGVLPD